VSYDLKAIIAADAVADELLPRLGPSVVVRLGQGLSLIPPSDGWRGEARMGQSARAFPEFENLTVEVAEIIRQASVGAAIAYVEGESFGNVGGQTAAVWRDGELVLPPHQVIPVVWTPEGGPIDEALRLLGVVRLPERDEFDSVGLGRFRHTEQWRVVPALMDRLPAMELAWHRPRASDPNYYATTVSDQHFSLVRGRGDDTAGLTLGLIGGTESRTFDALPATWHLATGPALDSSLPTSQPVVGGGLVQRLARRLRGRR